jgi:trehalose/maltose hydrolase-like predicted phosphorylase
MAGTWMSLVEGLAGVRVYDGELHINPIIPEAWKSYSFKMRIQNKPIEVFVNQDGMRVENLSDTEIVYYHGTKPHTLSPKKMSEVS